MSPWRSIHSARTLAEATLVQHSLEDRGIATRIQGASRVALAGELPLPDTMVEVWVEASSAGAAKIVLATIELEAKGEDWTCTACREANPATFDTCWSCGGERP